MTIGSTFYREGSLEPRSSSFAGITHLNGLELKFQFGISSDFIVKWGFKSHFFKEKAVCLSFKSGGEVVKMLAELQTGSKPGYKLSSKYLPLCLAEQRNSYRFGTTWGWVNDNFHFWVNYPFKGLYSKQVNRLKRLPFQDLEQWCSSQVSFYQTILCIWLDTKLE